MASMVSSGGSKATKPLKRKTSERRPLKKRPSGGAAARAEARLMDERDSEETESEELSQGSPQPPASLARSQQQAPQQPAAASAATRSADGAYQFRAMLIELDALVGFNSKKKLTNVQVKSVEQLKEAIQRRFLSKLAETESFSTDSFNIQYFDDDFMQYVDLHDLNDLRAVCKLQLVPTEFMSTISMSEEGMAVPAAQPVRAQSATAVKKASEARGTFIAKQESALSVEDLDRLRQQASSTSLRSVEEPVEEGLAAADFNFDSWKAQLMMGIPVHKRSAKDGKRRCRVLFCDPAFQQLNWRAPSGSKEKDHFDLFRGIPIWSKRKEALLLSDLQNVKAARSPGGLFFVRLVFHSRNVDVEVKTEEDFRSASLGFSMLMHESRGVLARRSTRR